jgi:hypothetical protein
MFEFLPPEIFRRIVDQLEVCVYIVDRAWKIQYAASIFTGRIFEPAI